MAKDISQSPPPSQDPLPHSTPGNGQGYLQGQKPEGLDKSGTSVRAMFSNIAGSYDLLNHLLSGNQDRRWRRHAVRLLTPRRGERILDLCCGTGDFTIECRRQQPNCNVVGADFAVPMLQLFATKIEAQPTPLLAGDALHLPFTDSSFDAVMVAFGARNFENTAAGLAEMKRIVKRGGRIMILEFMRPTSPLLQYGFGLFFKRVLPIIGKLLSKHNSAYSYLPASVDGFYTREEFVTLLRKHGFINVRAFDYSGGIATAFIAFNN
jgi:demethylmenaquinone methyltransferase/2-methoxy-6-polyprenyl-1,4-benzoquinol methylase